MKTKRRRDPFLSHYAAELKRVATFAIPHHGSDHNFHADLLSEIHPRLCVAAADSYGKWRHPGSSVVQDAVSAMSAFHLVTSSSSAVVEDVFLTS